MAGMDLTQNYIDRLRSLMHAANITSYRALAERAGVTEWQVRQLRNGQAAHMRVTVLAQISQALNVELTELLNQFTELPTAPSERSPVSMDETQFNPLHHEYERLQQQLAHQAEQLRQQFQHDSLRVLESWLIQFPTAAFAAQANPHIPASRLLPLMRPVEQLLKDWDVEAIAPVGAEVAYDPHIHQLMEGTAEPGATVKVRYTGYRHREKLLYRAKVSPIHHHA